MCSVAHQQKIEMLRRIDGPAEVPQHSYKFINPEKTIVFRMDMPISDIAGDEMPFDKIDEQAFVLTHSPHQIRAKFQRQEIRRRYDRVPTF